MIPPIKDRIINDLENYIPPTWDELFMRNVYLIASKSKDKRTKIGAVLVKNNEIISAGYNGICRMVNDNVPERHERPEKYFWAEHGERNSIYSAARRGESTKGAILYTQGVPCCDCTRGMIQAEISEIVVHARWEDFEKELYWKKWIEQAERSVIMLKEANIPVRRLESFLDVCGYLDGKIIKC